MQLLRLVLNKKIFEFQNKQIKKFEILGFFYEIFKKN